MSTRTLRGMTWDHPLGYDCLVAASKVYGQSHPDVSIKWEKRPLQAFADQPLDELAAQYDLIIMDHPHVGMAAAEGCLAALDGQGRDHELKKMAGGFVSCSFASYVFEGRQWALPIDAAAQVSAWRPDLIDADRVPDTWAKTIALAETGVVLWPIKPVDSIMSFFTLMANAGAPCCEKGRFADPAVGREVLSAMQALAVRVPRTCLRMNPINTFDVMATTDDYQYTPLAFGYSNYSRNGFRQNLLRFRDIPALGASGPVGSILGGTGIAISAHCAHIADAVDFAYWSVSPDVQKGVYFEGGGQPAAVAAWESQSVNRSTLNFFAETRRTLDEAYLRPRHNGYLLLQDKGGDAVHAFLSDRASLDGTLHELERLYELSLTMEQAAR